MQTYPGIGNSLKRISNLLFFSFFILSVGFTTANAQCPKVQENMDKVEKGGHHYFYAADFYNWHCKCKNGVSSELEAKQAAAAMKINKTHYDNFNRTGPSLPSPLSAGQCKIVAGGSGGSAGGNFLDPDKGILLNGDMMSLMNMLGAGSNNENFKEMVEEMNNNRQQMSAIKSFATDFGLASQEDIEFYNFVENASQVIAFGKFLFSKNKGEEETPKTPSQQKASKFITNISNQLKTSYQEVQYIPEIPAHDESMTEKLDLIQDKIYLYETFSAPNRLLVLRYLNSDGNPDVNDLNQWIREIESKKSQGDLEGIILEIKQITNRYDESLKRYYPQLLNKEEGFTASYNDMNRLLANYHNNKGDHAKAEEYLSKIDFNISAEESPRLIFKSYLEGNYSNTANYYDVLKNYMSDQEYIRTLYDLPHYRFDNIDKLVREGVTYMLSLGVLAYHKKGDHKKAIEELAFLKLMIEKTWYLDDTPNRLKKKGYEDSDVRASYNTQMGMYLVVKANLLAKSKPDSAIMILNEGEALYKKSAMQSGFLNNGFERHIELTRLSILSQQGKHKEALDLCYDIQRSFIAEDDILNINDIKFNQAILLYNLKQYPRSLNVLKVLQASNPNEPKYYKLSKDILLALGKVNEANEAERLYFTLLNQ